MVMVIVTATAIAIVTVIAIVVVIVILMILIHPVSITRFPLRRFSPGAGLLRNPLFTLSTLRFSRG